MIRTLIVEDEFTSRMILNALFAKLGPCDVAMNGREALEAFATAMKGTHYELLCLDISMPGMDGHAVLKEVRGMERAAGIGRLDRVKVIMTTASRDRRDVVDAFRSECDGYLVKPIDKIGLISKLSNLGLHA